MTDNTPASDSSMSAVTQERQSGSIRFNNAKELGALIRLARQRMGMTQADAAVCCGVGRRFFLELEGGKPTLQFDLVMKVLGTFGIELMLSGDTASFTETELKRAAAFAQKETPWDNTWTR